MLTPDVVGVEDAVDVVQRELTTLVEEFRGGGDLFPRDTARDVLDQQLLFGETEIHASTPDSSDRNAIVAGTARSRHLVHRSLRRTAARLEGRIRSFLDVAAPTLDRGTPSADTYL